MNLFTLNGTLTRKPYWIATLCLLVGSFVAIMLFLTDITPIMVVASLLVACLTWIYMSITVRRIRDSGCSGWFFGLYLLIGIIPYVGVILQIIWVCLPTNYLDEKIK